jgi:hypothetical protein
MNNSKRITDESLLKKFVIPLLLGVVTVLTFKFIMWNFWKVEQAVEMVGKIKRAKSAVNLMLANDKQVLLRKSFPFNKAGNYYIINQLDISPYIATDKGVQRLLLRVQVNGKISTDLPVVGDAQANIIKFDTHYFVFTTGESTINEFLRLREKVPDMMVMLNRQTEKINQLWPAARALRR